MLKVAPLGAVVQLARRQNAAGGDGLLYHRDDWNRGRVLTEEEKRCGLLLRLQDVTQPAPFSSPSSSAIGVSASPLPLNAVVKAQTTDFQVNPVEVSEASAAGRLLHIERCPKGRWRKISRSRTILVDHQDSRFSDPERPQTPLTQSLGEYVPRVGRLPPQQPVLDFALFSDGYSRRHILDRFRYTIGVNSDAVHLTSPPGGHFGCVTHAGCAIGVTRELLPHVSRHYNLRTLVADPRAYHDLAAVERLRRGPDHYFYRILLRCVSGGEDAIRSRLRLLSEGGFINYYGAEHFGVCSNPLFDVRAHAAAGDTRRAVGTYLQLLAESDPRHFDHFSAYLAADPGSALGAAESWCSAAAALYQPDVARLLQHLCEYHRQHQYGPASGGGASEAAASAALEALWSAVPTSAQHGSLRAASSVVWNAMASQRLAAYGPRVVKGDLVQLPGGGVAVVGTDAEAAQFKLTDVVLPVPLPRAKKLVFPDLQRVSEESFRAFALQHKLQFLFDSPTDIGDEDTTAEERYRHLVRRPQHLQASVLSDPSSLTVLKSDLFLLQERRRPDDGLVLDYTGRVREPSPYNVSERFAQRMQPIRAANSGTHSVVLTFALPRDSSPLVALREPFSLVYAVFHDLTVL